MPSKLVEAFISGMMSSIRRIRSADSYARPCSIGNVAQLALRSDDGLKPHSN